MASKWRIIFHPVFTFLKRSKGHFKANFKKYLSGLFVSLGLSRTGWYILLSCITAIATLLASPTVAKIPIVPIAGVYIAQNSPESTTEVQGLDQRARKHYANGQFREAATAFQQASQRYQVQGNILGQAISLSNLSLANQHLGLWTEASEAISESLRLLQSELPANNSRNHQSAYAQALDIHARLDLEQGQAEQAIATWKQASKIYIQLGQPEQALESQIEQAHALQSIGLHIKAIKVLEAGLKTSEPITRLLAGLPEEARSGAAENPAAQLNQWLQALPPSPSTIGALQSLAESLQVVGNLDQAHTILEYTWQLAEKLSLTEAIASAELNLGNVTRAKAIAQLQLNNLSVKQAVAQLQKQPSLSHIQQQLQYRRTQAALAFNTQTDKALDYYQQAAIKSSPPLIQVQAQLNRLSLLLDRQEWTEAAAAIEQIEPLLNSLPSSRAAISAHINLAQSLVKLASRAGKNSFFSTTPIQHLQAAQLLATAHQQASSLNNDQADSYALGSLGELYEYSKQWTEAEALTRQALDLVNAVSVTNLPSKINDSDLAYRWQYQLGRILQAQNNRAGAVQAYEKAARTLQEHLRKDVASSNLSYQFSFHEDAQQPVHQAWMDLLLQSEQPSQEDLQQVRKISSLLLEAQLTSFLQEPCAVVTPQQVDNIVKTVKTAKKTAVFYPIILPDRLEVIVKLPREKALLHYRHLFQDRDELQEKLGNLQIALEEDYTFEAVENLAQQFYTWIVKPAEDKLEENEVDTLVFTLDRELQSIPMAALYNGEENKYLIEKYAVSSILSLKFGSSDQKLPTEELKFLWAGLSTIPEKLIIGGEEIRNQFLPLKNVKKESKVVEKSGIKLNTLMDDRFTLQNFNALINEKKFNVVHLATHGQFSFDPQRTFLLTHDPHPIDVDELAGLFRKRGQIKLDSIDLLILNACETAAGDSLATLGIAGAAVRAGALSAIASLWTLDDLSSVTFTQELYKNLKEPNVTKAEALRQAQLALKAIPQYRHPRYWSPYILAGNWLPLTTSSSVGSTGSKASN